MDTEYFVSIRHDIREYEQENGHFLQKKIAPTFFGICKETCIELLNMENVGAISTSYQHKSDKPTLYPIEEP